MFRTVSLLAAFLALIVTAPALAQFSGGLPISVDPPSPPANLIIHPVWAAQPTAAQIADAYPAEAAHNGMHGPVHLECIVLQGGVLNCASFSARTELVLAGFLVAAQSLTQYYRMAEKDADGAPTEGRPINVTIVLAPR